MLIYIIHGDYISTFRLPKEVSGNYMLSDIDSDGKNRSLINISGSEGKWYFNSNFDVRIVEDNLLSEKKEIVPYNFYTLNYFEKEYVYIYVLPGYEDNYSLYEVTNNCNIVIGSAQTDDIVYSARYIAPKHMQLSFENGVWKIALLEGKVPFYVNKRSFKGNLLTDFDQIFIMGLRIIVISNKLIIMAPPSSLVINSKSLFNTSIKLCVENKKSKEIVKDFYQKKDYFYKSPIFKKKYDEYEVTITPPEIKSESSNSNFLSELIPSILMGLTSFVSLYYAFANYDGAKENQESFITNIIMCIVFLITGIVWPFIENIA